MAAEIALHNEIGFDRKEQPHAHILLTMRKLTDDGFSNKVRSWNTDFTAEKGKRMRKQFADRMNQFFEAHNIAAKVDHRSYAERGVPIPAAPEIAKKHWKKWKRHRAVDQTAQPPKPIADYFAWKTERYNAVMEYADIFKELKHEQQRNQNKRAETAPTAEQSREPNPHSSNGSGHKSASDPGPARRTARGERRGRSDPPTYGPPHEDRTEIDSDREANHADREKVRRNQRIEAAGKLRDRVKKHPERLKPAEPPKKRNPAAGGADAPWIGKSIQSKTQALGVARRWNNLGFETQAADNFIIVKGNGWRIADYGNRCLIDTVTPDGVEALVAKAKRDWGGGIRCSGPQNFLEDAWLECQRQGVEMSVRGDPEWQPPEHIQIQWQTEIELRHVTEENVNQVDKSEHDAEQPSEAEMLYYQQQQAPKFGM